MFVTCSVVCNWWLLGSVSCSRYSPNNLCISLHMMLHIQKFHHFYFIRVIQSKYEVDDILHFYLWESDLCNTWLIWQLLSSPVAQTEMLSKPIYNHILAEEDCLSSPCSIMKLHLKSLQIHDIEVDRITSTITCFLRSLLHNKLVDIF